MRTYEQITATARRRAPFANGSEWERFQDRFCGVCVHDSEEMVDRGEGCPLILAALSGLTPVELEEDSRGVVVRCTEFVQADDVEPCDYPDDGEDDDAAVPGATYRTAAVVVLPGQESLW